MTVGQLEALLQKARVRVRVTASKDEPSRLELFAELVAKGIEPCAAARVANAYERSTANA